MILSFFFHFYSLVILLVSLFSHVSDIFMFLSILLVTFLKLL